MKEKAIIKFYINFKEVEYGEAIRAVGYELVSRGLIELNCKGASGFVSSIKGGGYFSCEWK